MVLIAPLGVEDGSPSAPRLVVYGQSSLFALPRTVSSSGEGTTGSSGLCFHCLVHSRGLVNVD